MDGGGLMDVGGMEAKSAKIGGWSERGRGERRTRKARYWDVHDANEMRMRVAGKLKIER